MNQTNIITKILLLCLCLLLVTACSKDTDDKLDGRWQIQQVEADGNVQPVDTFFYNFQTSLFQYQVYNKQSDSYSSSYGFKTVTNDNTLLLELENGANFLRYTDWASDKRSFTIEKVSGSRLILESEGKRYTFRKF